MSNDRVINTPASSDLATFTIKIDGTAIDRAYQVMSVVISKEVNRVPLAKLIMLDGSPSSEDFPAANSDLFLAGNEIEILAGYHTQEDSVFKGVIIKTKVNIRKEGASTLHIDCRDKAFKMTTNLKNKYFKEIKDSEAIEEILGDYDLEMDIEATQITHEELVQRNTSDWDFMLTRVDLNGKLCIADDGKITVKAPDLSQSPAVSLQYGATILEFDAEVDARYQYQGVSSVAWNYSNQEIVEVDASEPGLTEAGNIASTDIGDALALDTFKLNHGAFVGEDVLQLWADAKLLKNRLAKIRGRVKFQGLASVKPGNVIEILGVGERLNGNHLVSGVLHTIANGKWETDAQLGINPEWFTETYNLQNQGNSIVSPTISGLQIGIVTKLEGDPTGDDRIQVKLPVVNPDDEGVWSRLACLDAGDSRGTFFRPEIDDEVVVGFFDDDPRNPVVLGMLHSSAKPTPTAISDDNHEKGYVSRSEMKLVFNDDKKSVTLQTPAGKMLVIDEDDGSIKLEDENGNKIMMNSDGITIESAKDINLKASGDIKLEGVNIENTAQANFKADGSAGSDLTSSAILKIQGSLVQIN